MLPGGTGKGSTHLPGCTGMVLPDRPGNRPGKKFGKKISFLCLCSVLWCPGILLSTGVCSTAG
eukprot:691281-Amphidinium_carterae.1